MSNHILEQRLKRVRPCMYVLNRSRCQAYCCVPAVLPAHLAAVLACMACPAPSRFATRTDVAEPKLEGIM